MPSDWLLAGRYRLLETIGRGGMGTVWWARDEERGTEVAVKEIHLPPAEPDWVNAVRRTHREAVTAGRLRHPGIVSVHDLVVENGKPWLIMEYVAARSLDEVVATHGPLSPERVAGIGLSLLSALAAAHDAGILHRDVKPANVLLEASGRVVLTDFGIATWDGATKLTQSGTFMGSPAYVAPEIARGEHATQRSDLWSLGATLYTAVEGRPPYHHDTALATIGALITDEPDPPRQAGELKPLLGGLLRKDAAKRLPPDRAATLLREARDAAASTLRSGRARPWRRPASRGPAQEHDIAPAGNSARPGSFGGRDTPSGQPGSFGGRDTPPGTSGAPAPSAPRRHAPGGPLPAERLGQRVRSLWTRLTTAVRGLSNR